MNVKLNISGMACSGCTDSVQSALEALKGVESAEVKLEEGQALVNFDENVLTTDDLAKVINEAGYEFTGVEA